MPRFIVRLGRDAERPCGYEMFATGERYTCGEPSVATTHHGHLKIGVCAEHLRYIWSAGVVQVYDEHDRLVTTTEEVERWISIQSV